MAAAARLDGDAGGASVLGVHYSTVRRWADWCRAGGLDEVVSHRKGRNGGQSRLNKEQLKCLAHEIAAGRLKTAADVKTWIAYQYSVSYTIPGVYALMQRAWAENVALGSRMRQGKPSLWDRISVSVGRLFSLVKSRRLR